MNTFGKLVAGLIEQNKINRTTAAKCTGYEYDPVHYALDFCTVHVNIGRRSGKTHLIDDLAIANDVALFGSSALLNWYKYEHHQFGALNTVCNPDALRAWEIKSRSIDYAYTVFVDEPALVSRAYNMSIEEIYRHLVCPRSDQTFVLLGA